MIIREMPSIAYAINEDSWNYLLDYWPPMAKAIETEVGRGASPEEIRRMVLSQVGESRAAIALRCKQAAAYVLEQNGAQ